MTYAEFLLRREAAALRQLIFAGAVSIGMGTEESTRIPIAQLREVARA